ncbi:MAG: redoxin protein [Mycobacterium sp.]|jgi:hypothetical protein|nr:redoxin protein [Mycobacterium sp.]
MTTTAVNATVAHELAQRAHPKKMCTNRRYLMRSDIVPGAVFPDYSLPDHTDTVRSLSELQGDDPLVLTLSRGHF